MREVPGWVGKFQEIGRVYAKDVAASIGNEDISPIVDAYYRGTDRSADLDRIEPRIRLELSGQYPGNSLLNRACPDYDR